MEYDEQKNREWRAFVNSFPKKQVQVGELDGQPLYADVPDLSPKEA